MKYLELVGLGAEPRVRGVGEDRVEHHEALDESSEWGQLAVPVVGVVNRLVERLVVQVVQAAAMERPGCDGPGVAADHEPVEEVVRLLAVGDAGEGAVLPLQKDAAVDEDQGEKPRLARAEPEQLDAVDPLLVGAVTQAVPAGVGHTKSAARSGSRALPPRRLL